MNGDGKPLVANVSDTARWVAGYRAIESARTDALFKDPLAGRLAGETGLAIVERAKSQIHNGWPVIARTKTIDDMVLDCVANGCDCVINLAAGLDTRPYRLDLPVDLDWIEADLPGIVAEKTTLLAGETARCHLERVKVDLSDSGACAAFLTRASGEHERVLVISEGLIMYLDDEMVRTLSHHLARPQVAWWVLDTISPRVRDLFMRRMANELRQAPMQFAPDNGVAFFEDLGWIVQDACSLAGQAQRFHRLPWHLALVMMLPLPKPNPRRLGSSMWAAVLRLQRNGAR